MEKEWCPLMNHYCKENCALMSWDPENPDVESCAFRIIANQLTGGLIGIKTYGGETVCVTTDPHNLNAGFHIQ